ncbi:hypothetical protein NQ314_014119 [Rhamnusium bicolor]|uniref:Uncharacterized protein n=1 Tax=Rhamnusium bicolor TaxID=1586634 RepID=A0AAV8X4J7_9CUCU|nr:hypothetical protein NQ314_014119 [Rhamnusium bicolor]
MPKEAEEPCENITKGSQIKKEYRRLSEAVLALILLLNRKRIGEIQYLTVKTSTLMFSQTIKKNFYSLCPKVKRYLQRVLKEL